MTSSGKQKKIKARYLLYSRLRVYGARQFSSDHLREMSGKLGFENIASEIVEKEERRREAERVETNDEESVVGATQNAEEVSNVGNRIDNQIIGSNNNNVNKEDTHIPIEEESRPCYRGEWDPMRGLDDEDSGGSCFEWGCWDCEWFSWKCILFSIYIILIIGALCYAATLPGGLGSHRSYDNDDHSYSHYSDDSYRPRHYYDDDDDRSYRSSNTGIYVPSIRSGHRSTITEGSRHSIKNEPWPKPNWSNVNTGSSSDTYKKPPPPGFNLEKIFKSTTVDYPPRKSPGIGTRIKEKVKEVGTVIKTKITSIGSSKKDSNNKRG